MAGFKHTGVGNASARNHYAALGQVQDGAGVFVPAANVGGTADAITLTPSPAITSYAAGQRFSFVAEAANTGAVTVATSGLTARSLTKEGSTALVEGDIASGALVTIHDDGTRYQIVAVNGVATKHGSNTFDGPMAGGPGTVLTLSTGSITPTGNNHQVDTESSASTDDLTDIDDANMPDLAQLTLRAGADARTVVVKNGSGDHKIHTADGADYSLDDNQKTIELELRSGEWFETGRSAAVIASQSDMETGQAVNVSVTPGRQHFHPGHPKAVVQLGGLSSTPTIATLYNALGTLSAIRNGAGDYTLSWTNAISSPMPSVSVHGINGNIAIHTSATTSLRVQVRNDAATLFDPTLIYMQLYGDM